MALRKTGKVDMASLEPESDPRVAAADEQLRALEHEQSTDADRLQDASKELRSANAALKDLDLKILLGEANEGDVNRARAQRDAIETEMTKLRLSIAASQARLKAVRAAREELVAVAKRDASRRALEADREIVKQQKPLLLALSALEEKRFEIREYANFIGQPDLWPQLRNDPNGKLNRWLNDAETFDWEQLKA